MGKHIENKKDPGQPGINGNGNQDELLQWVLEAVPHAISVYSIIYRSDKNEYDFALYALNAPASELAGVIPSAVIGKNILQVFPPGIFAELSGNLKKAVESGKPVKWEYFHEDKWLHNTATLKGDLLFVTTENITLHKQSEQKIQELNRMLLQKNRHLASLHSELTTFTNIAANEYKETLKKLYTIMEFIVTNDARNLSNEGRANIRRGQAAIQKMKLLTEDILSFSSLQTLETEKSEIDLNAMIPVIAEDLRNTHKEVNVHLECDQLPRIQGYPLLISLLFHHLLTNSIKFKKPEEDAYILIQCMQVNGSAINHTDALPESEYNLISIKDKGIGFEVEDAKKIFGLFYKVHYKNKHKGSGISLAVCNKIMEMHEGFITAEGKINEGAVFNCYFPVN